MTERKVTLIIATQDEGGEVRRYEARADTERGHSGAPVLSYGYTPDELNWLAQRIANGSLCGYDCDHCNEEVGDDD